MDDGLILSCTQNVLQIQLIAGLIVMTRDTPSISSSRE